MPAWIMCHRVKPCMFIILLLWALQLWNRKWSCPYSMPSPPSLLPLLPPCHPFPEASASLLFPSWRPHIATCLTLTWPVRGSSSAWCVSGLLLSFALFQHGFGDTGSRLVTVCEAYTGLFWSSLLPVSSFVLSPLPWCGPAFAPHSFPEGVSRLG